jgi:hypothetical protein
MIVLQRCLNGGEIVRRYSCIDKWIDTIIIYNVEILYMRPTHLHLNPERDTRMMMVMTYDRTPKVLKWERRS